MHELFRLEETLPLAPGTSPFHVRGIYYLRVVEDAKSLPGGMRQFLDELPDPRVRDFMRQKFQFTSWYDALPTLPCGVALARIRRRPFEEFMRETGRQSMVALAPSMFRIFSRFGGPRFAAAHAPRLFQAHFDFFELQLLRVTNYEGSGVVPSLPLYLAPTMVNQLIGIITGALECLGASAVEASYRDVRPSPSKHGFDMVTCGADLKWHLEHEEAVGSPRRDRRSARPEAENRHSS